MATNLLLITTDQQRRDSLPCYGRDFVQAPAMERLAAEGSVFDSCIVPAPLCVPCRAAILSGRYPSSTGVFGNSHWLPDTVPTWSAEFTRAGIRTAAIGKMHFNPWDDPGGFGERIIAEDKRHTYLPDHHVDFLRSRGMDRPHPTSHPGYFESLGAPTWPHGRDTHIDAFVGDRAAEWLDQNGDEPFAAWVSFPGPHDPYDPPPEYAELYADAPIPEPIGSADDLVTRPHAQRDRGAGSLNNSMFRIDPSQATPEQIRRWRQHYYANITLIDEGIGKILDALERKGILDETLIVFTSDHGDALGDHGLPFKGFFYESMVGVPLIIRGPNVPVGWRTDSLVSTLDLVPLFYATMGVEPPDGLQGKDLALLLYQNETEIRDAAFSEVQGRAMVRTKHWKYARYQDGSAELYDLLADPDETENLADDPSTAEAERDMEDLLIGHWLGNQQVQGLPSSRPQFPERVRLEEEYKRDMQDASET